MIIDAGVAVRWCVVDGHTAAARLLIQGTRPLTAPDLILPELCNSFWKLAGVGAISDAHAEMALRAFPDVIALVASATLADLVASATLADRALVIARSLGHPAYDCFYLALAERTEAPVITLDKRLYGRTRATPWAGLVDLLSPVGGTT